MINTGHGGWACLFIVLLAASGCSALPQCNSSTVNIPGASKLVFAVIGDWGRVGAIDSLFAPNTVNLCATKGQCCSNLQQANYPDNFDYSDVLDGPQQRYAATLLNEVCGAEGCQFILGMGDNFYPCGADAYESGLNRFVSDWQNIYHTETTPYIADLKWYHVVGNHDYGFSASVPLQEQYAQSDSRWVFPSSYYNREFTAGDVSMSISFLDQTPFIGTYAHPKPKPAYYTPYLASKITPEYLNSDAAAYLNASTGVCNIPPRNASFITEISDDATGQIPWLKSCLQSSNATWDVVSAHFALFGSDVNWGANTSIAKAAYPGNCGAFGSLSSLISEYGVDAYFNGHDHTQTAADPLKAGQLIGTTGQTGNKTYLVSGPNPATQYFTLGNGGSIQYADGVTPAAPKAYNDFSDVIYNSNVPYTKDEITDAASDNAAVGEGFAIVTADECVMQVDFYNIQNYSPEKDTAPLHTHIIDKCGPASLPTLPPPKAAASN